MKFKKLKLFSPLLVKEEAPYENPWDGGEDFRIMLESEKKKCRNEICENITEMLSPTELPHMFKSTVYSAVPTVEEKGKSSCLYWIASVIVHFQNRNWTAFAAGGKTFLRR